MKIAKAVTGIVSASALLAIGYSLPVPPPPTPEPATRYVACATEDSAGPCYWDARVRGNGKGHSFVVHEDGRVEYVDPETAFPQPERSHR